MSQIISIGIGMAVRRIPGMIDRKKRDIIKKRIIPENQIFGL